MADEQVRLSDPGNIEKTGWISVGQGVMDNGIAGAVIAMLCEVKILPVEWQGPQTIVVLTAVLGMIVKFLRKLFIRYKIVE